VTTLLLIAPGLREHQAAAELRDTLDTYGRDFAVLDHGAWHPESLRTTYDGVLDITYHDMAGTVVHVLSADTDLRDPCQEQDLICSEDGRLLIVREPGAVDEVRVALDDGTIASVRSPTEGVDLPALAEQLRTATSEDRETLVDTLSRPR
jgi:hypothetical protein